MGAIAHCRGTVRVVALGQLADPIGRIAGALGHLARRLPAREQPEDLPPAALMGLMLAAIASLSFIRREVGVEGDIFWHPLILQHSHRIPYHGD